MAAAKTLFPEITDNVLTALRHLVPPRVRSRLAELKTGGRALPFLNGSPGATNGVAALKIVLKVPMNGGGASEHGVT